MSYQPLILVAEDDEINRELIKDILEESDYRVNEAVNGAEAVKKAVLEVPDLILMDVEMPVMNGLDAIRKLMEIPETHRVPIIVMTGMNETEDRIKAFDCGAMDFVAKPYNAHELLSHVRSYLRFSILNKKYVLSTLNPETKIPNRAAFNEKIPDIQHPVLFLIKIDNVEAVSRFYGEATGKEIEINFSQFLQDELSFPELKPSLFHLDKGLFGFLLDSADKQMEKEEAKQFAADIVAKYGARQKIKDTQYEIELTVVIAFEKEKILEKSELALDEALRNKTGIMVVDDVIQELYHTIGENIVWLKRIKEAVQDERLVPFFQPILNSNTGKIEKYESLLRMLDKNNQVISPGKFLLIAKNSRYYPEITRAITLKAFSIFENRQEGVSVNLSALDIENKATREFLIEALHNSPNTAPRVTFEIVEQEGVKHFGVLKEFITQVKQLGVGISIDDFGSGYSNFRMLMDMDVDFIKIDGSLIRNIQTDIGSRNVVETINTFAQKTGIRIIAEYVENEGIMNTLKEMGIYYFQGYHIGKPMQF